MSIALLILAAYIGGGIPIGLIAGKVCCGIDVREFGSKNIGASNVMRTLGWKVGIPVFILDVAKGLIPVLASHSFHQQSWLPVAAGFAAIMGHTFSPFLGFRGGKGVATTLGVAFGLTPIAGIVSFSAWTICLLLTRYISVSSMMGMFSGCFCIWWFNDRRLAYGLFAVAATAFVAIKHRANFDRLRKGTEPKASISLAKMIQRFKKSNPPQDT